MPRQGRRLDSSFKRKIARSDREDAYSVTRHRFVHPTQITQLDLIVTTPGIVMSLHLHRSRHPPTSERTDLQLLAAYENGSLELWRFSRTDGKQTSVEGVGWECVWGVKQHVESGE
jgi:hypothetical protein